MLLNPFRFAAGGAPSDLSDVQSLYSGYNGGFYNFTDPSTLWADTSRTTPATVGGYVRGVTDLSGNGLHLSTSSTDRFVLEQAGSQYYVRCIGGSGTSAFVTATGVLGSSSGHSQIAFYRAGGHTQAMALVAADNSSARLTQGITLNTGATYGAITSTYFDVSTITHTVSESTSRIAGRDHLASVVVTTAGGQAWIDGGLVSTLVDAQTLGASNSSARLTVAGSELGTPTPTSQIFVGALYVVGLIGRPLSDSQRGVFESYARDQVLEQADPPVTDAYIADTVLIINPSGSDGSTTATDLSPEVQTITALGNAQIDTSILLFGQPLWLFDGTGDSLSVAHDTSLNLTNQVWTLEMWVLPAFLASSHWLIGKGDGATAAGSMISLATHASWQVYEGTTSVSVTQPELAIDVATFTGVKRTAAGYIEIWKDGFIYSRTSIGTATLNTVAQAMAFGNYAGGGYNGRLGSIRLTVGVDRDLSIVPIAPFPTT